jgi:ABC-type multidrug transport system ATPase subunit
VLFLHKGRVLASGTPDEVVRFFKGKNLEDAFLRVTRSEQGSA